MATKQYSEQEPAASLTDSLQGDVLDSLILGIGSSIIMKLAFGKNISIKSVINIETLKEGAKMGASIGIMRRVGSPMINTMLQNSPVGGLIKL